MKIGISLGSARPGLGRDALRAGAASIVERAAAAHLAGLDSLTIGDQHATGFPYFQNVPILGRALTEWHSDRPVGCLFLLPLWNPVLVAEQAATLATLTEAPFVIQVAIGGGDAQFAAMGASTATRGRVFDESLRVVQALLRGEMVDSSILGIEGARVSPVNPGEVQWWIAGGVEAGLRRAAQHGDAWYATAGITPRALEPLAVRYGELCDEAGTVPRTIVRRDVIVLADGDRARRLGSSLIDEGYRGSSHENVTVGNVDDVAAEFAAFEALGVDEVVIRCMSVDQDDALETIEQCGELGRRFR